MHSNNTPAPVIYLKLIHFFILQASFQQKNKNLPACINGHICTLVIVVAIVVLFCFFLLQSLRLFAANVNKQVISSFSYISCNVENSFLFWAFSSSPFSTYEALRLGQFNTKNIKNKFKIDENLNIDLNMSAICRLKNLNVNKTNSPVSTYTNM